MDIFKRVTKALATPIRFSVESGHFWSALLGKSVDSSRRPIPMLTYPALDALDLIDLSDLSLLEWGTGQSSIYFSSRVKSLVGVESSPEWAGYVRKRTPDNTSIRVCSDRSSLEKIGKKIIGYRFDIVLIDGKPYSKGSRMEAAEITLDLNDTPKLVIVDNSDLPECDSVVGAFQNEGFLRADFVGYSPGAYYKQCTSFFFKPKNAQWALGNNMPVQECSPYSKKINH